MAKKKSSRRKASAAAGKPYPTKQDQDDSSKGRNNKKGKGEESEAGRKKTTQNDDTDLEKALKNKASTEDMYLDLAVQEGLIPLGPDPSSGLEEFLHWPTQVWGRAVSGGGDAKESLGSAPNSARSP